MVKYYEVQMPNGRAFYNEENHIPVKDIIKELNSLASHILVLETAQKRVQEKVKDFKDLLHQEIFDEEFLGTLDKLLDEVIL